MYEITSALDESLAIDREKFPSKSVIAPTESEPLS
jgi:hypothetical protein